MIKTTVLFLLFASTAVAQITSEKPVSTSVLTPAPGRQTAAAVASDGERYLAAWIDERGGQNTVYAARTDADGRLLDPTNIRLDGADAPLTPSVVYAGGTFVVLWNRQTFDPVTGGGRTAVFFARIDSSGNVVQPPRLLVDAAYLPDGAAASNGQRIALFLGRRLVIADPNGTIVSDVTVPIPEQGDFFPGVVTSNGSDFLVAWSATAFSGTELDAIEFDANGHVLSQPKLIWTGINPLWVAAASDGRDYLLVFGTAGDYSDVRVAHGTLATSEIQVVATPVGYPNETKLTWSGTGYVLSWTQAVESQTVQAIFTERLDASGTRIDTAPAQLINQSGFGIGSLYGVATNGRTMFFAWPSGFPNAEFDIHGMAVDAHEVRRTTETVVSQSTNEQLTPDIAFSGRNYLAVWNEPEGVYCGRVSLDGQPLDGRGIRVSSTATTIAPHVVFDGAHYVVGYERELVRPAATPVPELRIARVDADSGALLDGEGVAATLVGCVLPFDLATNGTQTLAVVRACGSDSGLLALRIDRSAQPIGIPVPITPRQLIAYEPSIAWSGSEWLVAFDEMKLIDCGLCGGPPGPFPVPVNVRAVRLTPDLTVLDTQPLAIAGTADEHDPQSGPQAASNGSDFLVTWTRSTTNEVDARHVSLAGTAGGVTTIGRGVVTSTIWTGGEYASAFTTPAGIIQGATSVRSFVIGPGDAARLVSANGRITAAYQRLANEPAYGGVRRVFLRDARIVHGHAVRR